MHTIATSNFDKQYKVQILVTLLLSIHFLRYVIYQKQYQIELSVKSIIKIRTNYSIMLAVEVQACVILTLLNYLTTRYSKKKQ